MFTFYRRVVFGGAGLISTNLAQPLNAPRRNLQSLALHTVLAGPALELEAALDVAPVALHQSDRVRLVAKHGSLQPSLRVVVLAVPTQTLNEAQGLPAWLTRTSTSLPTRAMKAHSIPEIDISWVSPLVVDAHIGLSHIVE